MSLERIIIVYSDEEAEQQTATRNGVRRSRTIVLGTPLVNYGIRDSYNGQIIVVGSYEEREKAIRDAEDDDQIAAKLFEISLI